MDTAVLIEDLNRVYGWDLATGPEHGLGAGRGSGAGRGLPEGVSPEDALEDLIAEKVNAMIQRDFGALVPLLYRVDVSEERLRRMLDDNSGEDAGRLIARLIMERQWQKIESRRQYRRDDVSGADEGAERW